MKRLFTLIMILACGFGAHAAQTIVTATVTFTNSAGTTNGQTLVANGDTRTFTNNVQILATQIGTNATATGSATNAFTQISAYNFTGLNEVWTGPTNFTLSGGPGVTVTVTLSPAVGNVTYGTQTLTAAYVFRVPITAEPNAGQQTNIASLAVQALSTVSTSSFYASDIAVSNLVGITNSQTVSGVKKFTNVLSQWLGVVSNSPAIGGTVYNLTNGYHTNGTFDGPILTNGVNYGNAFSSPAAVASGAEQFGVSAIALGAGALAVGQNAQPNGSGAVSIGKNSSTIGNGTIAIGLSANATNSSSVALGSAANAWGVFGTAIGPASSVGATHQNSTAIGYAANTTASNQVMLGSAGVSVEVNNILHVGYSITNAVLEGTNAIRGDVAFPRYALTSLANGNNSAIPILTNLFVEVSGPSGAFTINGIAGGRDGRFIIILNQTTFNMTIAHDSGVDPTAANRIYTMTGADRATTGNGAAMLIYSAAASRWILVSLDL